MKPNMLQLGLVFLLASVSAVGAGTNSIIGKLDSGVRAWQSFWGQLDDPSKGYQLDLEGSQHILDVPSRFANPTGIAVSRFGPSRGPDSGKSFSPLPRGQAEFSTTNQAEITDLMSALRAENNRWRIENMSTLPGYTYLLSLLQETNRTIVEVRVFEPTGGTNGACAILPRDGVGSVYYGARIGPWIHSRTNAATAGVSTTQGISTNTPSR